MDELYRMLRSEDGRELLFVLENLGYVPDGFDWNVLAPLVIHKNDKVRFWAVKSLGKAGNSESIVLLKKVIQFDTDSMVRREAVSSIGRMRIPKAIPILKELLNDPDPKITLQAIRGLFVFKNDPEIRESLLKLSSHPNEMVQSVIRREFGKNGNSIKNAMPHPVAPAFMKNVIVKGDVREIIKLVPDESIHLTFTSPPYYNARDYSTYESYTAYLDFLTEVFKQVHRITKEGRFLVVNTSPVIVPRVSRSHASKRYPIPFDLHTRLVTNGWEFVDDIVWMKPETSVKNRNAGFLQHRKPLAYKPNAITEYLMVYRKQTDKLLDWNMDQYVWEVIEESRVTEEYETSNVWKIDPAFDKVHSAVFPLELCNRIIKFYSYKGDLVFDPFGGSGTLGIAARKLERSFFMTEQENVYIERMRNQLGATPLKSEPTKFIQINEFRELLEGIKNANN